MKKTLLIVVAAVLLVMGVSSSWGQVGEGVSIDDTSETGVIVTTNPPLGVPGTFVTFTGVTHPNSEAAQITGTMNGDSILPLISATTAVFLLGTGASGDNAQWTSSSGVKVSNISDFITFTVTEPTAPVGLGPTLNIDGSLLTFTIYFESDNPDFQTHLNALVLSEGSYTTTPEDGTFQPLGQLFGVPFDIDVASDAPEAVPLPSALLLLGAGLLRLANYRRRKMASST